MGRRVLKANPDTPFGRRLGTDGLDYSPVLDGGKVIFGTPAGYVVLDPIIDHSRLESLEHRGRVAEVIDADLVEIVQAL